MYGTFLTPPPDAPGVWVWVPAGCAIQLIPHPITDQPVSNSCPQAADQLPQVQQQQHSPCDDGATLGDLRHSDMDLHEADAAAVVMSGNSCQHDTLLPVDGDANGNASRAQESCIAYGNSCHASSCDASSSTATKKRTLVALVSDPDSVGSTLAPSDAEDHDTPEVADGDGLGEQNACDVGQQTRADMIEATLAALKPMSVQELRTSCREQGVRANGGRGALAKRIAEHVVDAKHESASNLATAPDHEDNVVDDAAKHDAPSVLGTALGLEDSTQDNVSVSGTEPFEEMSHAGDVSQRDSTAECEPIDDLPDEVQYHDGDAEHLTSAEVVPRIASSMAAATNVTDYEDVDYEQQQRHDSAMQRIYELLSLAKST